jgi:hypothetical protein
MFKTRIRILTQDWIEIESYKSRFKPSVGDFIYSEKLGHYLKVLSVIHNIGMFSTSTIAVIEEIGNDLKIN